MQFPLICRTMINGDKITPLGMKGVKRLSDFFTDNKVDNLIKPRLPIIINPANEIICLPGLRVDNKFKVKETTKKVLIVSISSIN